MAIDNRQSLVRNQSGFTLIELLVVVAVIALLVSILLPSLSRAKELAKRAVCANNLRALAIGNELYQQENRGHYVPGAINFKIRNCDRWFGARPDTESSFDDNGPIKQYLPGKIVRQCPSFVTFLTDIEVGRLNEAGCGGYGYNNSFVGTHIRPEGDLYEVVTDTVGNRADDFRSSAGTIAFTDAAFVDGGLKEYSFAEPPKWENTPTAYNASAAPVVRPSIHFRHLETANIVWLDAHVSSETLTFSSNISGHQYPGKPIDYNVGWFGTKTIELFDTK